jgi:hypothetical protein
VGEDKVGLGFLFLYTPDSYNFIKMGFLPAMDYILKSLIFLPGPHGSPAGGMFPPTPHPTKCGAPAPHPHGLEISPVPAGEIAIPIREGADEDASARRCRFLSWPFLLESIPSNDW